MSKGTFPFFIPNNEMTKLRTHLNSIEFDPQMTLARLNQLDDSLQRKCVAGRERFVERKRLSSTLYPEDEEKKKEIERRAKAMQEQQLKAFENEQKERLDKMLEEQRTLIYALPKTFSSEEYERNLVKMKEMIASRRLQLELLKQRTGRLSIGRMRARARESLFREEYSQLRSRSKRRDLSVSLPPVSHSFLTETPGI